MVKSLPTVVDLLNEHGPMLSSDISRIYRRMGVNDSAARQRVNRRSDEVKTLYGLPFPKGARFLYIEGDFGDLRFYRALISKLQETKSAYGAAIGGMLAREGICLADHWPVVSGSPDKQKGHISHSKILDGLKQAKLIEERDIAGLGPCLNLNERYFSTSISAFRSRLTIEHILRNCIHDWAIKLGWSSNGSLQVLDEEVFPKFSTMSFDLVGPCYLQPLVTWQKGILKNGFFVCDVISSGPLQEDGISGFLKKVTTLKALRNLGRFQPMLLASSYSEDALMLLRSRGIIAATPESLFGRQVADALAELLRVLQQAAEIAIGNPEKIEELFNQLSGFEGNLRGSLFELIVGNLVRMTNGGSIDIGVLVTDYVHQNRADIDVRLVNETEIVSYECKGHGPDVEVTLEEVKYWLEKQVPIIRAAHLLEQRFDNLAHIFEFWTTGQFSSEALTFLESRKSTIKKYTIRWRGPSEVEAQASTLKNKTMHKLLKRFYQKDPLSDI